MTIEVSSEQLKLAINTLLSPVSDATSRKQADSLLQRFRASSHAVLHCMRALMNRCAEAEAQFLSVTLVAICRKQPLTQPQLQDSAMDSAASQLKLAMQLAQALNLHDRFSISVHRNMASALALIYIRGAVPASEIVGRLLNCCQWTSPVPLLHLLHALAYETTNKQASMHPDRRSLIVTTLGSSAEVASIFANALQSASPCFEPAICALEQWSSSFGPPPGLESHNGTLLLICTSVFHPSTCRISASCLCSLFTSSKEAPTNEALLHSLLFQWTHASNSSYLYSINLHNQPLDGSDWLQDESVLVASCQVLSAAATSIMTSKGHHQDLFPSLFSQLLALLGCFYDEVVLLASDYFSDQYLPSLKSQLLASSDQETILASHSPLLQALAQRLVHRSRLKQAEAVKSTADARDIGDESKTLRRELTSTLKIISSLVGHVPMINFTASIVKEAFDIFNSDSQQQMMAGWTGLEACLYAANVCVGCWLPVKGDDKGMSDSDEEGEISGPGNQPDIVQAQPSSNHIDEAVASLIFLAALSTNHVKGHVKLAGTALTLIGGLSHWPPLSHAQQSTLLSRVQETLFASIRSSDHKLSRNGATTFQRLCSQGDLSRHFVDHHPAWIGAIATCYLERGGMVKKAGPREDATTEEILLMALSKLACLLINSDGSSRSFDLLGSLLARQMQLMEAANRKCGSVDLESLGDAIDIITAVITHCEGSGEAPVRVRGMTGWILPAQGFRGSRGSADGSGEAPVALGHKVWGKLKETIGHNNQIMTSARILDSLGSFLSACIRSRRVTLPVSAAARDHLMELISDSLNMMSIVDPHLFYSPEHSLGLRNLLVTLFEGHHALGSHALSSAMGSGDCNGSISNGISCRLEQIAATVIQIGCREVLRQSSLATGSSEVSLQGQLTLIGPLTEILTASVISRVQYFNSETLDQVIAATYAMGIGQNDVDECHAILSWYETLFKVSYLPKDVTSIASVENLPLRLLLESSGSAPRLLQGLYLAALSMPSVLILKISSTLHTICISIGADRFTAWSLAAFLLPSPLCSMPPWQGLKPEARIGMVGEMIAAVGDLNKFKRIVKLLTGGKKKGENVG